jgi:hypothetical protein
MEVEDKSDNLLDWNQSDGYRTCFEESIRFVIAFYADLFTDEDISQLSALVALPLDHMCFLSRIINRKYTWLRLSSCLKYIPSVRDNPIEAIINAVTCLSSRNIIEMFDKTITDEYDIKSVLFENLRFDEVKNLAKLFNLKVQGFVLSCPSLSAMSLSITSASFF